MRRIACVRTGACAARTRLARVTVSPVPRRGRLQCSRVRELLISLPAYSELRHAALIRDQFTKQAEQFSKAAPLNDKETLEKIIKFAGAGAEDEMIDFAYVILDVRLMRELASPVIAHLALFPASIALIEHF